MSSDVFGESLQNPGLVTAEHWIARVRERIESYRVRLANRPTLDGPLAGPAFQQWRDMCNLELGRIAERLVIYRELQLVPPETCKALQMEALAIVNRAQASVILEGG